MKYKLALRIAGVVVLAMILVVLIRITHDNSRKVQFVDEEMGAVIAYEAYYNEIIDGVEDFRQEHLESITILNIGYTGYYTTLIDIEKLPNLQSLYIGAPHAGKGLGYYNPSCELPEPENAERIEQLQNELASILVNGDGIKRLYLWDDEGICEFTSLEFLKNGDNLKYISLSSLGDIDYTPVWECSELITLTMWRCEIDSLEGIGHLQELKYLNLNGTNIAEAGEILDLPNLETLLIKGTPLAENEEELALIYEAFPDIDLEK